MDLAEMLTETCERRKKNVLEPVLLLKRLRQGYAKTNEAPQLLLRLLALLDDWSIPPEALGISQIEIGQLQNSAHGISEFIGLNEEEYCRLAVKKIFDLYNSLSSELAKKYAIKFLCCYRELGNLSFSDIGMVNDNDSVEQFLKKFF